MCIRDSLQPMPMSMREKHFNPRGHISLDFQTYDIISSVSHFNPRGHISLDNSLTTTVPLSHNFNPRGHISLDLIFFQMCAILENFNPRGHISLDAVTATEETVCITFQSTRPHKPRRNLVSLP